MSRKKGDEWRPGDPEFIPDHVHMVRDERTGVSYEERLVWLKKQEDGAIAERYGFQMAKLDGGNPPYSSDAYLERRFLQGYGDGCTILGKPIREEAT